MASLTPQQAQLRRRFEQAIAIAAPLLDAVLAVGDRLSRMVAPEDHEHYPARPLERQVGSQSDK